MATDPTQTNGNNGVNDNDDNENGDQPKEPRKITEFKALYETARSLEKYRIGLGNRLSAVKRQVDVLDPEIEALYKRLSTQALDQETEIDRLLGRKVETFPVWNHWLRHVQGIGPSLGAHLLGMLLPPLPERGPSTWWKAAGMVPEQRPDGTFRLPRARVGEGKITYHPWLRRCLWLVGEQFVKNGRYYRAEYEREYGRLFSIHCWNAEQLFQQWSSTSPEARRSFILSRYTLAEIINGGRPTAVTISGKPAKTAGWKQQFGLYDLNEGKPMVDDDIDGVLEGEQGDEGGLLSVLETQLAEEVESGTKGKKPKKHAIPAEWWGRYIEANGEHFVMEIGGRETDRPWQVCDAAFEAAVLEPKRNRAYYLIGPSDATWELHRIHASAKWAMLHTFTSHLYEKWLESEGYGSRKPYVIEKLGHTTYYAPPEPPAVGKI